MQVSSIGQEDPLEEGTATHSREKILPCKEEPCRLKSIGSQRARSD